MTPGNPAQSMDVAQSAGTGFDIRLEVIGGVVVAGMANLLLFQLRLVKRFTWPKLAGIDFFSSRYWKVSGLPHSRRDSCKLVATVKSSRPISIQSSMVRTLWPTSSLRSHRKVRNSLTVLPVDSSSRCSLSSKISTSESGWSSPRPYPPTAISASSRCLSRP